MRVVDDTACELLTAICEKRGEVNALADRMIEAVNETERGMFSGIEVVSAKIVVHLFRCKNDNQYYLTAHGGRQPVSSYVTGAIELAYYLSTHFLPN